MNDISITGASGFIGTNLTKYLAGHGSTVSALSVRGPDWQQKFPKKGKALIHLAGLAHDTKNKRRESEYFKINTELTSRVFDEFLNSGIERFLFFSSVKAVCDFPGERVVDEEMPADPKSVYGISKLKAEEYILSRKLPEGKKVYILRPAMVHGPGNKGNLNLLYSLISKGIPYPFGAFKNRRSFLSIDNLSYMVESLLLGPIESGTYHLADSDYLSTVEVVEIIAATIGTSPKIWHVNKAFLKQVAKWGDTLGGPMNSETLFKLTGNYMVSNAKLLAVMDKPLPITAQAGITQTILSFQGRSI